jgi:hypothetical protein
MIRFMGSEVAGDGERLEWFSWVAVVRVVGNPGAGMCRNRLFSLTEHFG